MCAIYAFMRRCDDLSDEPGASREALDAWRAEMVDALDGRFSGHPVWPAFRHTVRRFGIPHVYFHEMIDGVLGDLSPRRFETFAELYRYCYQVASVVGLTSIHVFGFDTRSALPLAEKCGVAFQLTNILRDVREDLERGRVYLPAEDLARFGVTDADLADGSRALREGGGLRELMRFEAGRARAYYRESQPLLDLIHPAQPPVAVGADRHLLAAAGADRSLRLRRLHPAHSPSRAGESHAGPAGGRKKGSDAIFLEGTPSPLPAVKALEQAHLPRVDFGHRLGLGRGLKVVVVRVEPANRLVEPEGRLPDVEQQQAAGTTALDSRLPIHGRIVAFVPAAAAVEFPGSDFQTSSNPYTLAGSTGRKKEETPFRSQGRARTTL